MTVNENIKTMQEQAGMSQAELSRKIDVSQPFLNKIERGKKNPPLDVLIEIAKVFECTIDELVYDRRPQEGGQA